VGRVAQHHPAYVTCLSISLGDEEMSTEREKELTRERVRRFREREKEAAEQALRDQFKSQIADQATRGQDQSPQLNPQDLEARQKFLKETALAIDVLLEADAFLLWTLYPAQAETLEIPVPTHITAENIDDANAQIEAFAFEYEQSPWKKLESSAEHASWGEMSRLQLLDGITVDYGDKGAHIWLHISPGYRDLYKQYCKRLGKVPAPIIKPESVPTVPSTKRVDLEDRFLARMLALDKGFSLLPENEGALGKLFVGGRARIVWERMSERDQKAVAKKVQQEFAAFCEGQGKPLPQELPAQPTVAEILAEPSASKPESYATTPPEPAAPRPAIPAELHDILTQLQALRK
jgi:hypothetical protein